MNPLISSSLAGCLTFFFFFEGGEDLAFGDAGAWVRQEPVLEALVTLALEPLSTDDFVDDFGLIADGAGQLVVDTHDISDAPREGADTRDNGQVDVVLMQKLPFTVDLSGIVAIFAQNVVHEDVFVVLEHVAQGALSFVLAADALHLQDHLRSPEQLQAAEVHVS